MEASSAVTRTTSRTARPCAAGAAPPRSPHVQEEASHSGLLDPRERPRADARGGGTRRECYYSRTSALPVPPPRASALGRSHGSRNPECDASSCMCGLRGGAVLAAQGRAVREVVHATALPASICTTPTRYRNSATARLVVIM